MGINFRCYFLEGHQIRFVGGNQTSKFKHSCGHLKAAEPHIIWNYGKLLLCKICRWDILHESPLYFAFVIKSTTYLRGYPFCSIPMGGVKPPHPTQCARYLCSLAFLLFHDQMRDKKDFLVICFFAHNFAWWGRCGAALAGTRVLRRILPEGLFGILSINSTILICLYVATLDLTKDWMSPAVTLCPGLTTTNALGTSPASSSGKGITAASSTEGWDNRRACWEEDNIWY